MWWHWRKKGGGGKKKKDSKPKIKYSAPNDNMHSLNSVCS